jgi:two-component system nitrogen regulation response regulator GlnG
MLTRHFLQQSARQLGVEPKRISDAALAWLARFSFPGNVRQLENMCHWLTVMAPAQVIEPKDLPPEVAVDERMAASPSAMPEPAASAATPAAFSHAVADAQALANVPASEPGSHPFPEVRGPTEVQALVAGALQGWEQGLDLEASALLATDRTDVWDVLTARFEARLILAALAATRGRRIEAAQKLGIGRNTITRKIQELGLE